MWKHKRFKGLFKGVYKKRGQHRELHLFSLETDVTREYPSWQAAIDAGWVYLVTKLGKLRAQARKRK